MTTDDEASTVLDVNLYDFLIAVGEEFKAIDRRTE